MQRFFTIAGPGSNTRTIYGHFKSFLVVSHTSAQRPRPRYLMPFFCTIIRPLLSLFTIVSNEPLLVVEQANVLLDEANTQLLGRFENRLVVLAARRRGNVLDTAPAGAENVVDEWELRRKALARQTPLRPRNIKTALTKASLEQATSLSLLNHCLRSSWVKGAGAWPSSKFFSKSSFSMPVSGTRPEHSMSMALLLSARRAPFFHLTLSARS